MLTPGLRELTGLTVNVSLHAQQCVGGFVHFMPPTVTLTDSDMCQSGDATKTCARENPKSVSMTLSIAYQKL